MIKKGRWKKKKKIKEEPVPFKPFSPPGNTTIANPNPEDLTDAPKSLAKREVVRSELDLQRFFNDMQLIGNQVRNPSIKKPNFHYGDLSVTNYLLWLVLAELMIQNTKSELGER